MLSSALRWSLLHIDAHRDVCILLSVVYHVLGLLFGALLLAWIGSMNIDATAWMVNYKEELFWQPAA